MQLVLTYSIMQSTFYTKKTSRYGTATTILQPNGYLYGELNGSFIVRRGSSASKTRSYLQDIRRIKVHYIMLLKMKYIFPHKVSKI